MFIRKYRSQTIAFLRLTPLCAGVLVAGCGGSGGMAGTSAAPSHTSHAGSATIEYSGKPQASEVVTNGSVSTFSQAGATFSSLVIDPTPNLDATSLIFARSDSGPFQSFTVPANGSSAPVELVHLPASGYNSVAKSGEIALLAQISGQFDIETMYPDGSSPRVVLSNVSALPAISPNGQTIVYLNATDLNLYSIPAGGGTPKEIYSGGNAGAGPVWSPSQQQIAFTAKDPTTSHFTIYTMAATGGATTNVLPTSLSGTGDAVVSAWSPDGNTLACTWTPTSSSTSEVLLISLADSNTGSLLTPSGFSDTVPAISPDNRKLAFYRSNAGGASPGIYECDFSGNNPQLVVPDPSSSGTTGPVESIVWSFFLPNQTFVGTGGSLTTSSVSGFLMTQQGDQFASLLTMTATTPSTAKIVPTGTSTPGSPQFYTLSADAITNIQFTNVYSGAHTGIPLTSTPTVVVSIDAVTGYVDFVAPGKFQKQSMAVGPHSQLTGQFAAIYDSTGKNLAPSGATTIDVDGKTGKLISFR